MFPIVAGDPLRIPDTMVDSQLRKQMISHFDFTVPAHHTTGEGFFHHNTGKSFTTSFSNSLKGGYRVAVNW